MSAQDRSRSHRPYLAFKTRFDGLRLASVRHYADYLFRFENLANRHGYRFLRHLIERRKPSLADLLAATRFIELNHYVGLFSLKIGRRIVEREMSFFAYADKSDINRRGGQSVTNSVDHFLRVRFSVKKVIFLDAGPTNQSLKQILPEARGMLDGQPHILVQMKHLDGLPVHSGTFG